MMTRITLQQALLAFDKDKAEQLDFVDVEDYFTELNLWYVTVEYPLSDWKNTCKIEQYWMQGWMDTDSYVGMKAHYLNGVLAAVSYQSGRKADEEFFWVSSFAALEVKQYIESLGEEDISNLISNNTGLFEIKEG
jgi:hypothetical protein